MGVLEDLEKLDKLATQGPWKLEGPIHYAINNRGNIAPREKSE